MATQFDFFGNEVKAVSKPVNNEKRNWENAFQMCKDKRITIDYSKRNFEDIWGGVFA